MVESVYTALASALRTRLAVIADHSFRDRDPAAHLQALQDASLRITELQKNLPPTAPPRLIHFLEGCSYQKALALIENLHSPADR